MIHTSFLQGASLRWFGASPVVALFLVGCGGDPSRSEAVSAPHTLRENCSGCHDGSSPTYGFMDLRFPDSAAGLVGKPATGSKCSQMGDILIRSDGSGVFVEKLRWPPPCGDRMPQGTVPLSLTEIAAVEEWVKALANGR